MQRDCRFASGDCLTSLVCRRTRILDRTRLSERSLCGDDSEAENGVRASISEVQLNLETFGTTTTGIFRRIGSSPAACLSRPAHRLARCISHTGWRKEGPRPFTFTSGGSFHDGNRHQNRTSPIGKFRSCADEASSLENELTAGSPGELELAPGGNRRFPALAGLSEEIGWAMGRFRAAPSKFPGKIRPIWDLS